MKHFHKVLFISALLPHLMISCTDSNDLPPIQSSTTTSLSQSQNSIRTPEEALEAAIRASTIFSSNKNLSIPNSSSRSLDKNNGIVPIGTHYKSRSLCNDTLMYAVNFADSEGFTLISAIKATPELLAFIPEGTYSQSCENTNPGFNFFMESAIEYLSQSKENTLSAIDKEFTIIPAETYKEVADTIYTTCIPNRVKVFWSQSGPEGADCPNGLSGCAITAAAMAMTHFRIPTSIKKTYDGSNSIHQLDWDLMQEHMKMVTHSEHDISSTCSNKWVCNLHHGYDESNCTTEAHNMITLLCRELGHRANTVYTHANGSQAASSGTTVSDLCVALNKLGYKTVTKDYNVTDMVNDFKNSDCVMLMQGIHDSQSAHMWVCDAVFGYNVHRISYVSTNLGLTWSKNFEVTDYYRYNYYNWGWGHSNYQYWSYNGYYLSTIFQPQDYYGNKFSHNYKNSVKYTKLSTL